MTFEHSPGLPDHWFEAIACGMADALIDVACP